MWNYSIIIKYNYDTKAELMMKNQRYQLMIVIMVEDNI
jgi:hypothetical protein